MWGRDPAVAAGGPPHAKDAVPPRHRNVRCRRILEPDIPAVADLLARGFPSRSRAFWIGALDRLLSHARTIGPATMGYLLERDGQVVGALLTIDREAEGRPAGCLQRNLSSWYVDPDVRGFAPLMVAKATADRSVTYLNTSAAPHTRPVIEAQGFRTYAAGMFLTIPLGARAPTASVQVLPGPLPPPVPCEARHAALLSDHRGYGCLTAWACTPDRAEPFVFARRDAVGRILPCAHLIYCSGLAAFVRLARPLGRHLARHGILAVTVDANGPVPGLPGRFFARGAKYAKGPHPPRLGNLAYTEAALLGTMLSR